MISGNLQSLQSRLTIAEQFVDLLLKHMAELEIRSAMEEWEFICDLPPDEEYSEPIDPPEPWRG
jgi:hypothetical protein